MFSLQQDPSALDVDHIVPLWHIHDYSAMAYLPQIHYCFRIHYTIETYIATDFTNMVPLQTLKALF